MTNAQGMKGSQFTMAPPQGWQRARLGESWNMACTHRDSAPKANQAPAALGRIPTSGKETECHGRNAPSGCGRGSPIPRSRAFPFAGAALAQGGISQHLLRSLPNLIPFRY